jgi:flagellar basal-body rod protein FlgG
MTGSIYMAATGALAYKKRLEVLSNNLANVNTVGYKQDKNTFQAYYLSELPKSDSANASTPITSQGPLFWTRLESQTDFSTGPLQQTGNGLDMAVVGRGFFAIQTPLGIQYTRRGDFTVSQDGVLVTQQGYPVMGEGGEIMVESVANAFDKKGHKISVDQSGLVSVDGKQVDKLRIVDFEKPHLLEKVGHSLFKTLNLHVVEANPKNFRIEQGSLELSNVDAVRMMTEMIEVIRGYESYQKLIRAVDDVNAKVINEVGK